MSEINYEILKNIAVLSNPALSAGRVSQARLNSLQNEEYNTHWRKEINPFRKRKEMVTWLAAAVKIKAIGNRKRNPSTT